MSFALNKTQLRILGDDTSIEAVARHILASRNHVAERFREATGIAHTTRPNGREIQRAITYLRSQQANVALVARVINSYLSTVRG